MNISGNDLKKGDVLLMDDKLYLCMKAEHRVMGRKSAFCQAILRNIKDGTQKDMKFTSSEKLEKVDLFERQMQYLYNDGDVFHFMDQKTFDQIEIKRDFIGDKSPLLTEEMKLSITFYETTPISLRLPLSMDFEVIDADPEIKGATASAQYKSAKISNGLGIKVPGFVNVGDWVKINTESLEYVERIKK